MAEAKNRSLPADELFRNILDASNIDIITESMTIRAIKRSQLANPPGKHESLGDRLHWEYLIESVPNKIDIHIITGDKDYKSELDDNQPHPMLKTEWSDLKQSELLIYKDLSSFLAKHFPDIKITPPPETNTYVEDLVNSTCFASTHEAIRKISPVISLLSTGEIVILADAANENSQISAILCDEDVNEFYKNVLKRLPAEYPENLKQELIKGITCKEQDITTKKC